MATKSNTRPKAPPAEAPAAPPAPASSAKPIRGRLGAMVTLLRRPQGTTVAQLVQATTWKRRPFAAPWPAR